MVAVETFHFEDSSWIEGFKSMNPNYPLDYEVVTRYFELKDREISMSGTEHRKYTTQKGGIFLKGGKFAP